MKKFSILKTMSYDDCCNYFERKFYQWNEVSQYNGCQDYVASCGKQGLYQEFRVDGDFKRIICPFLKQYADNKENMLSSIVENSLAVISGNPLPATMDIVVGAALKARGYDKEGHDLQKRGMYAILLGAAGLLLYGAYNASKGKKGRKK